jgi:thiol-disulfide isomerase/thioredoxin
MNKKTKTFLLLGLFVLFIGAAVLIYDALSQGVSPGNTVGVAQGEGAVSQNDRGGDDERTKAPDFTVYDADGDAVRLSDLLGRPVVLNFWASWCPPCMAEMPEFNAVYEALETDVAFMMVDLTDGQRETKETGTRYIEDRGFSFPVYFDTEQEAANAYGVMSIPTTVFIDRDGYIAAGAQGAIDAKTLEDGIALIAAPGAAQ